jgi:formylglycine-generating enzyme required for sulfatase activity
MAGRIFINYRRRLSATHARLLYGELLHHFPKDQLFIDLTGLDGKSNWLLELERQVSGTAVMLSVIGVGWAEFRNDKDEPALHDANDFVRFEITEAWKRDIRVIPVLVDGAPRPDIALLPKALWHLDMAQTKALRTEHADQDAAAIAKTVAGILAERQEMLDLRAAAQQVPALQAEVDALRARRGGGGGMAWAAGVAAAAVMATAAGPWSLATLGLRYPGVDVVSRAQLDAVVGENGRLESRLTQANTALAASVAGAGERVKEVVADTTTKERQAAQARVGAAEKARDEAQAALAAARAAQAKAEADLRTAGAAAARLPGVERQLVEAREALGKAQAELKAAQDAARAAEQRRERELAQQKAAHEAALAAERQAAQVRVTAAEKARDEALARQPPPVAGSPTVAAANPRAGDVFRDCPTCPEMVVVPSGSFTMGSPANEQDRGTDEGPQRRVTIRDPFAVGKFEVTFAEWDACVAEKGCTHKPGDQGWGRGRRPVINVSWDDAKQYVAWLSRKSSQSYRLLTEAEWEYAARAGTTTPFSTGRTITTAQANFDGNYTYGGSAKGQYRQRTLDVGSFQPNSFGLFDMHGNVWEWVEDCYVDNYTGAPVDGSARSATDNCSRVLRGGSWLNDPHNLRAAVRSRGHPDLRYNALGFRLGRTLPPTP